MSEETAPSTAAPIEFPGQTCGRPMRIRLSNIPPMFGVSQVRKFVANTLEIPQDAIVCRKGPKWTHALLSFRPSGGLKAIPELEKFREKLSGAQWKRARLDAKLEEAREDPMLRPPFSPSPTKVKSLNDQVTPLWRVSYETQLEEKHRKFEELLKKNISNLTPDFAMEPIKASPQITGYRNKCEFTIALDKDGQPTVGFLLGGYKEGIITVENARDTVHVPEVLKALADHLEAFVRSSGLPIYDRVSKVGFWRLLLARVHDGDVMATVQVSSSGHEDVRGTVLADLIQHMKDFRVGEGQTVIKSFFIQETQAVHHGVDQKASFELKFGEKTVTQTQCGLKFKISPISFFQVNEGATEILYNTIKEYVLDSLSKDTVLLDLCCGTGTIGMTLAPHVKRVIGVELVKEAIDDAKINAALNSIGNVEFIADRVEAAIEKVIGSIPPDQPIVVVLDPPRNGVHSSVVKAVRRCSRICRVVFISCNPTAALGNFIDLTRTESKCLQGTSFALKRAVAVDLFPMTEHCELVCQFHRS